MAETETPYTLFKNTTPTNMTFVRKSESHSQLVKNSLGDGSQPVPMSLE